MDITFYTVGNDALIQAEQDIKPADWNEKLDWIDIRTDNRKEVTAYFQKQNLFANALDCIEHPEAYPFSNTFGDTIILNLSISNTADIYKTDYISVILDNKFIITIVPQASDLFNERNISTYSEKKYPSISTFLFYVLAVKTLAQSNVNMSNARLRLQTIEQLLSNNPDEISSNDVMSCERDINQLSDIIEDQYVGFGILASLSSANLKSEEIQKTRDTIKGFEPLDKAIVRLEKKAESLRLQYMLIQQEKSTRKINVLTIIQAVFVPLTFIAGVYGMNFVNMPELDWRYGYFLVWLVFGALASGLLIYFYKKGWFD